MYGSSVGRERGGCEALYTHTHVETDTKMNTLTQIQRRKHSLRAKAFLQKALAQRELFLLDSLSTKRAQREHKESTKRGPEL